MNTEMENALMPFDAGGDLPATGLETEEATELQLTLPQKAALVIAAMGPEVAGPIVNQIGAKHLRAVARAYAQLDRIPRRDLEQVVGEFVAQLSSSDDEIRGGFEETKELLGQFISSEEVIRLMDDIDVPGGLTVWEKLDRASNDAIAEYLSKQNAQLIAVILTKMSTEKASDILGLLETDLAKEIVIRLSKPMDVKREIMNILADTIEREFLAPLRSSSAGRNPGEMIGAMMNNIASEKRDILLTHMSTVAPDLMAAIKKSMLTFEDMAVRVPPNAVSLVIKSVEADVFLQAIKYGKKNAQASVDFIFKNISQRMVQQYEEQIEAIKHITVKDGEMAQAVFMSSVRQLAATGEITLLDVITEEEGEEEA